MKLKRHKRIRKILHFYRLSYRITPPYRIVVDPHFLRAAHAGKVMIADQLPTLLHQPATAFITPCVLAWMTAAGRGWEASAHIGRGLSFLSCRHKKKGKIHPEACIKALLTPQRHLMLGEAAGGGQAGAAELVEEEEAGQEEDDGADEEDDEKKADDSNIASARRAVRAASAATASNPTTTTANPTSASTSTSSTLSSSTRLPTSIPTSLSHLPLNPDKLIVAAQSSSLRDWVRSTPGIPLLFLHGSVPVMEAPSGVERFDRRAKAVEEAARLTVAEQQALVKVGDTQQRQERRGGAGGGEGGGGRPGPPRKKKAKGPNPLSVKKKKKKPQQPGGGGVGGGGSAGGKRKQTEASAEATNSAGAEGGGHKRRKTEAGSGASETATSHDE